MTVKKNTLKEEENIINNDEMFSIFENHFHNNISLKTGDTVDGTVVKIDDKYVYVDVNFKSVGKVPLYEFDNADFEPKNGDTFQVIVTDIEGEDGSICVSYEEVKKSEVKEVLKKAYEEGEKLTGAIISKKNKGFDVNLGGITAFLPDKYIDYKIMKGNESHLQVGDSVNVIILKITEVKNDFSVIVSRKAAKEMDHNSQKIEFLKTLKEGQIIKDAETTNIVDYGAFINIGTKEQPYDGLLHKNDMSWTKINHPSKILKKGDKIDVVILKINYEEVHISLGIKQLQENPWKTINEKLAVNDIVTGKITNVLEYGAFIELTNYNVEGLVHISEMSWYHNKKPLEIVRPEDIVKVQIMSIDQENHRISLSIKNVTDNPVTLISKEYPKGSEIEVKVISKNDFGILVIFKELTIMIHKSDLTWGGLKEQDEKLAMYEKDDMIQAKILVLIPEKRGIKLGIKQLGDNPYQKELLLLKNKQIVECVISKVFDSEINVTIKGEIRGFIKRSELSMNKESCKLEDFAIGKTIEAQIISINSNSGKVELSICAIEETNYKENISKYKSEESTSKIKLGG